MDGLDPCIGVGFLIRNAGDLRQIEQAFKGGVLSKLAHVYEKRPQTPTQSCQEVDCLEDEDLSLL